MLIVLTELLWSRLQGDYQTGRPHVFVCRFEAVIVIFSLPLPLCLSICLFVITAIASISSIAACVSVPGACAQSRASLSLPSFNAAAVSDGLARDSGANVTYLCGSRGSPVPEDTPAALEDLLRAQEDAQRHSASF